MNVEVLRDLVRQGLSSRKIAEKYEVSAWTIRYWLKKYNLKTIHSLPKSIPKYQICKSCCTKKDASKFYKKGKYSLSKECKECTNSGLRAKRAEFKKLCIAHLGGRCNSCGYSKCLSALEFHHKEPSKKDFEISRQKPNFNNKIKNELNKCSLLCSNCHREEHERGKGR